MKLNPFESAGVDSLHLDVMDNHMAPSLSFGPPIIKPVRKLTTLPLDAHLMIDAPWLFFMLIFNATLMRFAFILKHTIKQRLNMKQILSASRVAESIDHQRLENDIYYLKPTI